MRYRNLAAAYLDLIATFFAMIAGILVLFVTLAVSLNVFARYFFNQPIGWVDSISEASLTYIAFLPAAWLLKNKGHVSVEILFSRLSGDKRGLLDTLTCIVGAGACLFLIWYATEATWTSAQANVQVIGALTYPKWILLAPVPISGLLLASEFIRQAHNSLRAWLSMREQTSLAIERQGR